VTDVRKGQWPGWMSREDFSRAFRAQFDDPRFDPLHSQIAQLEDLSWSAYRDGAKAPRRRKAGPEFADPEQELSVEWLEARERLHQAARRHADAASPSRALLVCGAARNDGTCPGERSKTDRLVEIARDALALEDRSIENDVLDLSLLSSEYGRRIHPCKACVATAMPLCHWPCSCYPNHALGQVSDWMNEIYERFVLAHGVMIVTPVYWYQAPGGLKAMIDRLVCADGGNPDPTTTRGKDPAKAKELELAGWSYPKHLEGRAFSLVVHGDVEGVERVRNALRDWLEWMGLRPAGNAGLLDRYIGYYEPYATSHQALDSDVAVQEETRQAARALARAIAMVRRGELRPPDRGLRPPRVK
jgi:multimeric flavodoxin WrbA